MKELGLSCGFVQSIGKKLRRATKCLERVRLREEKVSSSAGLGLNTSFFAALERIEPVAKWK